jgi:ribonuclease-3 family protein
MEESLTTIESLIHTQLSPQKARAINPLALAYIGDGIFSDAIRKYLIGLGHENVNLLTKKSTQYVQASAQSTIMHRLLSELTDKELAVFKAGRNAQSKAPKNAKPSDYRYSTGFEALLGYLHLSGQSKRLEELIIKSITIINERL